MDWTMPLDPDDRVLLAKLRQNFAVCCSEIAANGRTADAMAAALASHLAATSMADLPPAAQPIWTGRVCDKPIMTGWTKERAQGVQEF